MTPDPKTDYQPGATTIGSVAASRRVSLPVLLSLAFPVLLGMFLFRLQQENTSLKTGLATPQSTRPVEEPLAPLPLGSKLPPLRVRDASGALRTRLGTPGKPMILVFTPTSKDVCSAFRQALTACQTLVDRYTGIALRAALITDVPHVKIDETVDRYDISIPVFSDDGRTTKAFHITEQFELFVINGEGELAFRQIAPVETDASPLSRYLDQIASTTRAQ